MTRVVRPFSSQLEDWLKKDEPKTLADLNEAFGEKGFAVLLALLLLPSALPLPTGGVTHVLEIIAMLLALELVVGVKKIWLPSRWGKLKLSQAIEKKAMPRFIKTTHWLERLSRPRLSNLLKDRQFLRLVGVIVIIYSLAAFFAPPFLGLDTLPSLGIVLIALGLIFEDFLIFLVGILSGMAGIALIIGLGSAVVRLFHL